MNHGSHPHAKRYDCGPTIYSPTTIPCRDPLIGIRHAIDLVAPRRGSRLAAALLPKCSRSVKKPNRNKR
jgi:hypothetical protein